MIKLPFLKAIILFTVTLTIISCQPEGQKQEDAVIMGHYQPYDEHVCLNRVLSNKVDIIDSADLSNGEPFVFNVNTDDYLIHRLAHKELYPIMVIIRNGDTVEITQVDDKAWPYRVKGPPECMLLVEYLERLNRDHYKVDSLAAIFHYSQDHPDFIAIRDHLNNEFKRMLDEHKAYARDFINRHPSSIASIVVINGFFKEFALFHAEDDFSYYEMVDNALMNRMPDNQHVKDFHAQVENIRAVNEYELETRMRLSPGRMIPEFSLSSSGGPKIGPQDFAGRPLLIYFWAGADAKSRQTNPTVRSAYESYNPYGLEVLNISFDKDPNVWESARELDNLPGHHCTDLKGAGSPVQQLFNLKMRLPYFYLVDTRGRIFYHSNDFSQLQGKIVELFKQNPDK